MEETYYRTLEIDALRANDGARTVEASIASTTPVERIWGKEVLNLEGVDLSRAPFPLLISHNPDTTPVGVVENVRKAGNKLRGTLRLGQSNMAADVWRDIKDGIVRSLSVGYRVHEVVKEDKDIYRVTKWELLEVSLVSIPADATVGIGRSDSLLKGVLEMKSELEEEKKRVREILAIGEQHKCLEFARKHVEAGTSLDNFRNIVLETVYRERAYNIPTPDFEVGIGKQDLSRYSIVRAIGLLAENRPLDGLEGEASKATSKLVGRASKGFFIPPDVLSAPLKRALSVGDATKGGFTVGADVIGDSMIDILRNKPLVAQLGAVSLTGLVGNVLIPRITGGATAYWLSETGQVTSTDQSFGQLALSPKRLVGSTVYSKELLIQSSIDVENFVRKDITQTLILEKDRAAINGLGTQGEPLGILNTSGVLTATFGAAATWAKIIDFESQIAASNADIGSLAYLSTPATRGKWKGIVKSTYNTNFLWGDDGRVNGYRAEATKQVPSDRVIFGNWADLIMADWAGIDVVVDPYSLKKTGQIEITITLWTDIGVRHAVSFCVSTDSGAQ